MSAAHFSVKGQLDRAGSRTAGTVTIDRETGMFVVRPLRSRRTYEMPLSSVADIVCRVLIAGDLRERRAAKKAKRA